MKVSLGMCFIGEQKTNLKLYSLRGHARDPFQLRSRPSPDGRLTMVCPATPGSRSLGWGPLAVWRRSTRETLFEGCVFRVLCPDDTAVTPRNLVQDLCLQLIFHHHSVGVFDNVTEAELQGSADLPPFFLHTGSYDTVHL
jgi:hypothetical protein